MVDNISSAINPPSSGNNTFEQFLSKAETFSGTPPVRRLLLSFRAHTDTLPQQHTGALSGVGAVATAPPGPLSGNITGYGLPSGSPSSSSSGSKPSSSGNTGSAVAVGAGVGSVVVSALLGAVALI
jgi:hypothetical protein